MKREYAEFAVKKTFELIAIDSPSGYTLEAMKWVKKQFNDLGFKAELTNKGGVLIDFGGSDEEYGVMFDAHGDTLGAMVAEIKPSGTLRLTNIGGFNANNAEAENVRVHTRGGKVYEGTIQLHNPSIHVNLEYSDTKRGFDTVEVYLDEDVHSVDEVKALGIRVGDYVCADPRSRVTESGYIKSRFLDDKLSVGMLMAYGKYIKDNNISLRHHLWGHVTAYEEVGHGASSTCPEGVLEVISVDMGCVGDGLECTEKQVSICAKDSGGPYNYEITGKLIKAAENEGADYAVDVYPRYGSDVEATLRSGHDIKHGLIGAGVFASHGYERSHMEGVLNTLKVMKGYMEL